MPSRLELRHDFVPAPATVRAAMNQDEYRHSLFR
jgi:hypothetical protein